MHIATKKLLFVVIAIQAIIVFAGEKKKVNISDIDKNMAVAEKTIDGVSWYQVDAKGFDLSGFYWRKPGGDFRRLPVSTEEARIPGNVDRLAWHTAGGMLRFVSNAAEIRIHAKLHTISRMDHMAMVGSMGFDLYVGSGPAKFYYNSLRLNFAKDEFIGTLFTSQKPEFREFTIHFPLYSGVSSLEIGVNEGAVIQSPASWIDDRPIVVYGTSIQQGGCASRPGMCHTNRLSRMLNRPFLNFGFSGNGKGDPVVAELLAEIKNPAMYILDYDANVSLDGLRKTLPEFIRILRAKHPETPILLVSRIQFAKELADDSWTDYRNSLTEIHMKTLKQCRAAGDGNIHFLDGTALLGSEPSECTVDGVHATDLGFYMISNAMAPVIRRILDNK